MRPRNTYIQMREHGHRAWRALPSALLVSDQVHSWLPSGEDIARAHADGVSSLSVTDMIELVEADVFCVGGRWENLSLDETDRARMLFTASRSPFDEYLRAIVRAGNAGAVGGRVILHQDYKSGERAYACLREGRGTRKRLAPDHPYLVAREIVESPEIETPPIVVLRARQFSEMSSHQILDPGIRSAAKYISRYIRDVHEREIVGQTYQLLRLSIEHREIMRTHGCDAHFDYRGLTSTLRDVSGNPPTLEPAKSLEHIRSNIDDLMGLIDFLLAEEPIRSSKDLLRRREFLNSHREMIWSLAFQEIAPTENLRNLIAGDLHDLSALDKLLGDSLDKANGAFNAANILLGCFLWTLDPASLGTTVNAWASVLSTGLSMCRYYLKNRDAHYSGQHRWPFVMLHETPNPTKDQVRHIVKQLDYRLNRTGRILAP